jgi:hypothetical protein
MRVQRKTEELAFEQTNLEREVVPDPVSASRDRNRAQTPRPWSLPLLTRSTVPYPLSPHIEHERVLPPGSLAETVSHVLASVASGSYDPERRDYGRHLDAVAKPRPAPAGAVIARSGPYR